MDQTKIICPYCGSSNSISEQKKDVSCQYCGSNLSDLAKETLRNAREARKSSTPTIVPQQASFPPPAPTSTQTSAFPSASHTPSGTSHKSPARSFPFQMNRPKSKIKLGVLVFPQLQQSLDIPTSSPVFHFGRNSILPLVSPARFDVGWLNSISRVRKQKHRVVHQHFIIRRDTSGNYFIEDTKSRWGTWVNRQQIKGHGEIALKHGDKIELMLSKPNEKSVFQFVILFQRV